MNTASHKRGSTTRKRAKAAAERSRARFLDILRGHICGIIDAHGAVHSVFSRAGEDWPHHDNHWPCQAHVKWRWNNDRSLFYLTPEYAPRDVQEADAIRAHLTRKYGLLWWENGHHDIDHLMRKAGEK